MSTRLRIPILGGLGACLLVPVWRIAQALPSFGNASSPYASTVVTLGPKLRHVSNMVTAVNFDFRGFDTVGEEFMLMGAVTGTVLLLRGSRGENMADKAGIVVGRPHEQRAESTTLVCRVFAPLTILFGLYMTSHATVTPGGGFQGGVIVASGLLLIYLGEGYANWRKLLRARLLAPLEAFGGLAFAVAGIWPMLGGAQYMENTLPLGHFRDMLSGGLMLIENAGVGLAVLGGFTMLFLEFMEETRAPRTGPEPQ